MIVGAGEIAEGFEVEPEDARYAAVGGEKLGPLRPTLAEENVSSRNGLSGPRIQTA